MERFDVVIIGGGMAGASLAYFLGSDAQVLLLEQESHPGFHATGRSAALYTQAYGNAVVRALTVASKAFWEQPPKEFSDVSLLSPRGALFIARAEQLEKLKAETIEAQRLAPNVRMVDVADALTLSPALRTEYLAAGSYEPDAMDMDVNAILQGFLKGARHAGTTAWMEATVLDLAEQNDGWRVETTQGTIAAAIVVNAAGAWAGKIAGLVGALPIQITAKRRTAFLFQPPDIPALMDSAMTIDIDEMFYFKPEAGLMLGSPADETPMQPQDIQADEWDIAVGADRVQQAADLPIKRIERSWAGLRSFADDKTPVLGFDPSCPGFFWLAGQGGYGIQMAAAMGGLAASTILGQRMPSALEALDFNPAEIAPDRFL